MLIFRWRGLRESPRKNPCGAPDLKSGSRGDDDDNPNTDETETETKHSPTVLDSRWHKGGRLQKRECKNLRALNKGGQYSLWSWEEVGYSTHGDHWESSHVEQACPSSSNVHTGKGSRRWTGVRPLRIGAGFFLDGGHKRWEALPKPG